MKKTLEIICLSLVMVAFLSCSSDNGDNNGNNNNPQEPNIKAFNISVSDFDNNGDATDIRISFTKPSDLQSVSSFRVFVVKASSSTNFNLTTANALESESYIELDSSASTQDIVPSASLKDSEGSDIAENIPYRIFVLSIGQNIESQISEPSGVFELNQPDIKAFNLSVSDFDNNADATDIRLSFTKPSELQFVSSFRIIVVKEANASTFNLSNANSLNAENYFELDSTASSQSVVLNASLKDSDGDDIIENTPYRIFILSIGQNTDNQLSQSSQAFQIAQNNLVRTLVDTVAGGSGGMAIDTNGNLYMADFGQTLGGGGDKVFKITPEGNVSVFATGFNGASGNDFDSQGNLFQSNINGQSISKITPDGNVTTFASGAPISNTVGISIDENDELYVADCDGHQLLKVDINGNISVYSSSSLLNCPNGITRDESNNLYVSNFYDGNLLKVTPSGNVTVLANLPGGGSFPNGNNGHVTYHNGFLYVIARSANQIYKVSLSGQVELLAGSGQRGSDDGPALSASFSLPNDLIFSNDGTKIYLNDVVPTNGSNIAPCSIRVIELVED